MNECYKCKYKGSVAGSCHSSCNHPLAEKEKLFAVIVMLKVGACNLKDDEDSIFVVGNDHGVKSGWFNWPMDFDPCWLEKCTGFSEE